MTAPSPAGTERLYRSGVSAIEAATARLDAEGWNQPGCGNWRRADTARHLLAVADWYHAWLDRAIDGASTPPFDPEEFDERNQREVVTRRGLTGSQAAGRFVERADAYVNRALPHWDLPFGFPLGTVTVGLHLGVAAAEWHLHAWDLTHTDDTPHHPSEPGELFTATGIAVAAVTGGLRGTMLRRAVPLAAKRSPWRTLLARSGRG